MGVALSARALSDWTVSSNTADKIGNVAIVETVLRVRYPIILAGPGG